MNKDGGGLQANDWLQTNLYDETQAGQDVRHRFQGDVAAGRSIDAAPTVKMEDIQAALAAAAEAAKNAAAAMNKVGAANQGSIVSGV